MARSASEAREGLRLARARQRGDETGMQSPGAELPPSSSSDLVENQPNAARLYSSLRDSGYTNSAAVADLVDNSVDAGASRVAITVEPESGRFTPANSRIVVADDGNGMDWDTLRQAMKLGSETDHTLTSDLGKFGMGLITASISMGRRLTVLTKTADGQLLKAVHDLDLIERENRFLVQIQPTFDPSDELLWQQYALNPGHGTVVVIDLCDQLQYSNAGSFANDLKKQLGQIFRLFIFAKSELEREGRRFRSFIQVNGDEVYAVDPLMLEENKPFLFPATLALHAGKFADVVGDIFIEVPISEEPGSDVETIRARVVNLPADLGKDLSKELGIGAANAGIYIMRNQREIAHGETLTLFVRHPNLANFRAELHVPATLDKRMRINWTKRRVEPDQALLAILKKHIGPHIQTLRKNYNRKIASETVLDHKAYETLISKKAKLLTLPPAPKATRQKTHEKQGTIAPKGTGVRRTGVNTISDRFRDRCEFREGHMTASGPLWEPDMEGAKVIVTFNVDHPLWTRFVLEREEDEEAGRSGLIELLHLLSYCLTTAEYHSFGDELYFERLVNMRQQLSNNMRVLLS